MKQEFQVLSSIIVQSGFELKDIPKIGQPASDLKDAIDAWKKASDNGYRNPRDAVDVLSTTLLFATNATQLNPKAASAARDLIDAMNGAAHNGITNAEAAYDLKKRIDDVLADAEMPGTVPIDAPDAPPGMEWQPRILVSDDARTFSQARPLLVPKGTKIPTDRPYYIDNDGNRIYPPEGGGWIDINWLPKPNVPNPNPEPLSEPTPAVSDPIGTTPDPLVKTIKYVDPLILDLDGDEIELTPLSKRILFDSDGDTVKTGTAWAAPDDGLLVWDRNKNSLIDNGAELFGDETILANGKKADHGFTALSELDKGSVVNGVTVGAGDGVFDAKDAQYANLRIWRDLNQDGISQAAELQTLTATGVQSINLASTTVNANYGDAILAQSGAFTRSNGTTGQVGSFVLAQNNFVRSFTPITVSAAAKVLPGIKGSGWVRDLQEAATISPELITIFNQAQSSPTRAGSKTAIASLLREWGNDSAYNNASKQAKSAGYGLILSDPTNAQEAAWMDKAIKASEADRNTYRATISAADLTKFDAMRERMVGGLEKVHAYEAFTGYTFLKWTQIQADAINYVPRFWLSAGGRVPVEVWVPFSRIIQENRNAFMSSQAGYIRVNIPLPVSGGTPHVETLWNRLVDDATTNLLPIVRLSKYLDLVDLKFSDTGVNFDFTRLNAGLAAANTANAHEGATLFLDIYQNYGAMLNGISWNGVEQLRTLMQRAVSEPAVRDAFKEVNFSFLSTSSSAGTESNDAFAGDAAANVFSAGAGDDLIDGQAGDDNLSGAAGDDVIFGGEGNDSVNGGDGADQLDGGTGNDQLTGGLGNNTYLFGRGDGQDMVRVTDDSTAGKLNTLQLKAGVTAADVVLRQSYDTDIGGNVALVSLCQISRAIIQTL